MRRSASPTRKTTAGKRSKVSRRKTTRRGRARKGGARGWFIFGLILVCLGTGFLMGRWLLPPPALKVPPVPLSRAIHLVDLAIRSQLYALDLSEEDVISRQAKVRRKGKQKWTETTTRIQLPKAIPSDQITGELNREIASLGREFFVVKKRDRSGALELQVRVRNIVAHRLIFYEPKVVKPKIVPKGKVAIVIDDVGDERRVAMDLLNLDVPLSFSVFPFAPYSKELAREAADRGRDVLLHLPMEPRGYPEPDPGEGRLLTTMGKKELLSQLERDLDSIPYIKGVNNHMGSRFTEDPERMRYVLEGIQKRGLFFLDSRTTPRTVGFRIARELGLKTGERNVFLDNERNVSRIKARVLQLIDLSLKNGGAIGIGHPYPETAEALREVLPSLRENGIKVVPVSSLLK